MVEVATERFRRGNRLAAAGGGQGAGHFLLLVGEQRLAEPCQRDLLLRAEVEPRRVAARIQFAAEVDDLGIKGRLGVTAFVGERDHQGRVAQRTAVVPEVTHAVASEREAFRDGFPATHLVALHRQCQPQMHQRQALQRALAIVVVQRTQGTQRRAIHPCQRVARVRLVGELEVLALVAAVELVAACQQVLAEPLQGLLQHRIGDGEAALARIQQELDDVRRQRGIDVVVIAPHREMPG